MELFLSTLLEIVKLTVPALVIYFTIQKVTKNQLNSIVSLKNLEFRQQQTDQILPLKLQAYERLTLMLSRTRLTNILGRINTKDVNIEQLKALVVLSVKQEIDHNTSQKLYVSDQLWQIVNVAIEKSLQMMTDLTDEDATMTTETFVKLLYIADKENGQMIHDIAQSAIKEEVNTILR